MNISVDRIMDIGDEAYRKVGAKGIERNNFINSNYEERFNALISDIKNLDIDDAQLIENTKCAMSYVETLGKDKETVGFKYMPGNHQMEISPHQYNFYRGVEKKEYIGPTPANMASRGRFNEDNESAFYLAIDEKTAKKEAKENSVINEYEVIKSFWVVDLAGLNNSSDKVSLLEKLDYQRTQYLEKLYTLSLDYTFSKRVYLVTNTLLKNFVRLDVNDNLIGCIYKSTKTGSLNVVIATEDSDGNEIKIVDNYLKN